MIAQYQAADKDSKLEIPRFYALKLDHKHLPEMQKVAGLLFAPMFNPVVGDFYQGEVVAIPLFPRLLLQKTGAAEIREFLAAYYEAERFVNVMPYEADSYLDDGFLSAIECNDSNRIELFVFGNADRILLAARFDNLGKGSSGAAVQNMNILLGLDEGTGLE
ncbi:MAG TPA: hypothetical protein VEC37_19660 [Bacillota bacterium]|nr:hypothetical protein [Bacillota bacterium]